MMASAATRPAHALPLLGLLALAACQPPEGADGEAEPEPSRDLEISEKAYAQAYDEALDFAMYVDDQQLAECWDRKGRRATPVRLDILKELVNDLCLDRGGCDERGGIATDGCWAEATIRVRGEAAKTVCGFYDRPVSADCGLVDAGICDPGWELVGCHEKATGKKGSGRKGRWEGWVDEFNRRKRKG